MSISQKIIDQYNKDGFVNIPSFYDLKTEILPIQKSIYQLISILIKQHKLSITQEPFSPLTFDSGLYMLLENHRPLVSQIYDAVKKIPSYVKLACSTKNEQVARVLLNTEFIGFASHGYGIRMDNPFEALLSRADRRHDGRWRDRYASACVGSGHGPQSRTRCSATGRQRHHVVGESRDHPDRVRTL